MCPITSVDSYYDEKTNKFILIIADEMGYVRIQDISSILTDFNLVPIDVVSGNMKRNPLRVLAIDKAEAPSRDYNDAAGDDSEDEGR